MCVCVCVCVCLCLCVCLCEGGGQLCDGHGNTHSLVKVVTGHLQRSKHVIIREAELLQLAEPLVRRQVVRERDRRAHKAISNTCTHGMIKTMVGLAHDDDADFSPQFVFFKSTHAHALPPPFLHFVQFIT